MGSVWVGLRYGMSPVRALREKGFGRCRSVGRIWTLRRPLIAPSGAFHVGAL